MQVLLSFPAINRRAGVERVVCETANYLSVRGHHVSVLTGEVDENVLLPEVQQILVRRPGRFRVGLAHFAQEFANTYQQSKLECDIHGAFCTASPIGGVLWVQAVHRRWLEVSKRTRNLMGRLKQAVNPFHAVALNLEMRMIGGRQYAKLIALTEDVANDLMHFYNVPATDIEVLPNGVNPDEFKAATQAERLVARTEFGLPAGAQVIAFAANEVHRKGFVPLLRAVAKLHHDVWVLAAGRLQGNWSALLRELNLENRVVFTGPTSNVSKVFAAADIFALPTIYEAWGLVIIEALASGIPVITSRLAGAAIAISEGQNGLLLDTPQDIDEIASKLVALLDSAQTRSRESISKSVAEFHWTNILSQYESILADARSATH